MEAPGRLEAKTNKLEKRLLLRQFITRALAIKRDEIAELSRQRGAGEVSSETLPTTVQKSAQGLTLYDVVQLARQQALADKTRKSNQDLIDLSDTPQPWVNPNPSPSIENDLTLLDFDNPTFSHQSLPNLTLQSNAEALEPGPSVKVTDNQPPIAEPNGDPSLSLPSRDTIEFSELDASPADSPEKGMPTDPIAQIERRTPCKVQVPIIGETLMTPDRDQPGLEVASTEIPFAGGSDTKEGIELHAFPATNDPSTMPRLSDVAPINEGEPPDEASDKNSVISSVVPSIFSHSSSLTAVTGSSLPGISEEDMQARSSRPQLMPGMDSLDVKFPSSPSITKASIREAVSDDKVYLPETLPQLPNIDEPDGQGFPWIVQAARDGQEDIIRKLLVSGADIQATHTSTQRSALVEASFHGHQSSVDLLIEEGCSLECADVEGNTALHHACARGHLAIAKSLINRGASINVPGSGGQSALHFAIGAPYQNVVMLLIQHKANVNARDMLSRTPLHVAASQGNVAMCTYLLNEGAQLDSREARSKTPLQFACEAGNYEMVQTMMDQSRLNATNMTFLTAFFAAVECGHVQIAEIFFSKGLKLQELKRDGNKPLTLAATSGCLAMVELMIQEGCEIQTKDDSGWNALHFASDRGHYQVIDRLLSSGVSATARTARKETPLLLAVKRGHFPVAERLLRSEKGSSLTSLEDERSQQPVHHAVRNGSLEIFELLMSNGGKINVENSFGWQPLHVATAYGHLHLVERLLQQGATIEEKLGSTSIKKDQTHKIVEEGYWAEARWPYPGSRALHLACEYSNEQIAHLLISKGAKMEASCSEGWQPLHHATYFGSSTLVEKLLQGGVNPHAATNEGKTASTLGVCTAGRPIPAEEEDRIKRLLGEAMKSGKKQKNFKVALKKASTVQDKHNFLQAATFSMTVVARPQLQKAITTTQVSNSAATRSGPTSSSFRPRPPHHAHTAPLPSKEFLADATTDFSSRSRLPAIQVEEEPATLICNSKSITESIDAAPSDTPSDALATHSTTNSQTLPAPSTATTLYTPPDPKLKRRTTFGLTKGKPGLDMSKLSLAGMSKPAFDIGKQTLDFGNKTLELGKQGVEISKQGLERSKQGLDMGGKRGVDFSKQGYNKAMKFATRKAKRGGGEKKKADGKGESKGGGGEVVGEGAPDNGDDDEDDDSNDAKSVFSLGEFGDLGSHDF